MVPRIGKELSRSDGFFQSVRVTDGLEIRPMKLTRNCGFRPRTAILDAMSSLALTPTALEPKPVPTPITWGRKLRSLALRLAIYWTVYTLSIGPMFWMWYEANFLDGHRWIAAFYFPLLYACERIEWFGNLVNWYINLWIL